MDRELDKLRNIRIEDYTYNLPDERIAKFPLAEREASKLLIYRGGRIEESRFSEVRHLLRAGQMLVFNNTKVIHARLFFRKATGAVIEVFCLEPYLPVDYAQNFAARDSCEWSCMVGNLKKWKEGSIACDFTYGEATYRLTAEKVRQQEGELIIRFSWTGGLSFSEVLEGCGRIPIPPYLNRESEASDEVRYQTVYSKEEGSVAAPTAGACGVMPAVLVTYYKEYEASEETMIQALYVAAGIGQVIASRASLAGASGGCQAEIGSASGMAAAAICSVRGGSKEQMGHACAMALKNLMGLVCDPVAGLVEVPCVKRNVGGAVNALAAADMALAGIASHIPVDQVIDAMGEVGMKMDVSLRETSMGGVATSPKGLEIAERLGM